MRSGDVARGPVRSCTKVAKNFSSERTGELKNMQALEILVKLIMLPIRIVFWLFVSVLIALFEAD